MLNTRTHTPPPKQVLLRLPDDLAAQLAHAIPPRQRNKFLVDLVAKALAERQAQEDQALVRAAEYMNALEARHPELVREADEWLDAPLTEPVDVWDPDFDREAFERGLAEAQAALSTP
ncbi:MAG: hypothetical protein RL260_2781 [Pseudomonadota bacterium]|jgi:hypothetical protein